MGLSVMPSLLWDKKIVGRPQLFMRGQHKVQPQGHSNLKLDLQRCACGTAKYCTNLGWSSSSKKKKKKKSSNNIILDHVSYHGICYLIAIHLLMAIIQKMHGYICRVHGILIKLEDGRNEPWRIFLSKKTPIPTNFPAWIFSYIE